MYGINKIYFKCKSHRLKAIGYIVQALPGSNPKSLEDFHKNYFEGEIWPSLITSEQSIILS